MTYEIVCRQSDGDAWHEARWSGFSASVIPMLMGYDSYAPSLDEIILNHARRINTVRDNGYMALGRYFERGVMDWATGRCPAIAGRNIDSWGELLRSKSHPFVLATPDGRIGDELVEVKTRTARSAAWKEGVPAKVRCQVQVQLFVTGLQKAMVVDWKYPDPADRYEPKDPVIHFIERDDAEIDRILNVTGQAFELVKQIREREGL